MSLKLTATQVANEVAFGFTENSAELSCIASKITGIIDGGILPTNNVKLQKANLAGAGVVDISVKEGTFSFTKSSILRKLRIKGKAFDFGTLVGMKMTKEAGYSIKALV